METKDVMEVSWTMLSNTSETEVSSFKMNTHTKQNLDLVKRIQEALRFRDLLTLKLAVTWQELFHPDPFLLPLMLPTGQAMPQEYSMTVIVS